jgi:hypothetical protein
VDKDDELRHGYIETETAWRISAGHPHFETFGGSIEAEFESGSDLPLILWIATLCNSDTVRLAGWADWLLVVGRFNPYFEPIQALTR